MAPFELAEPGTLEEAFALLQDEDARPLGGGTALMLMMKAGVLRPKRLVSLRKLGFDSIDSGPMGELRAGATVSLRALEKSEQVRARWPVLARALRTLSNVRVRNVATVGGCLAHADPHMDLPPLLCALGASVALVGRQGVRNIPLEQLTTGYLETSLRRGELIGILEVPPLGRKRAAYLKCTTRSADDWPALGIAVASDFQQEIRIFVGAATDRPTRLTAAEAVLKKDHADVKRAAEAALAQVHIESDLHGSADYKKQLLRVYLARAIDEARNASH
jgi:carbon-monoxide dehydrogenase medium subunit